MKERSGWADLMKGIAVVLMIQVHLLEVFAHPALQNSTLGKVSLFLGGSFVAPVFMVLLGYFIAVGNATTLQLLKRGIVLFCAGMLLNLLMNLNLIMAVNKGELKVDLMPYVFGVDILHVAGLSCLVMGMLKPALDKLPFVRALAALAAAGAPHFLLPATPHEEGSVYILSFFYGLTKWSYFPLFPWLAYPLAGMAFYSILKRPDVISFLAKLKGWFIVLLFMIFMLLTGSYAFQIASHLSAYYHHGLSFFSWNCAFLLFYVWLTKIMNNRLGLRPPGRSLKWMGKNVTLIYMIQWVIIGNIGTGIFQSITSIWSLSFYFIVILAVSTVLTLLIIRVKEALQKA